MKSESKRVCSNLRQLREIQKILPGNPAISTIVRWGRRGLLGPDGNRIKLPMRKIGGKLFVLESDLWGWLDVIEGQHGDEMVVPVRLGADELDRRLDAEQL